MVIRTILVTAALSGPLSSSALGQTLPIARIDSVFTGLNRADGPGCTLGVFRDGEVAYANGYGMANLEYGIALWPRSVFHVASISKQFTAFAVELLVSEGKVSWDDPIQKYVPEILEYGTPITLRNLVHHTSGIRDQWDLLIMAGWRWEADLVTQENAIEIISRQKALNFEPGSEYLYSNSGYTLLAAVVERVTGQTLKAFSQDRIFGPLRMTSTHFHDDHETIVPDRAYGYRHWGSEGWKISIPDFAIVGASSLFTTVEDMAKWDRNLRDQTIGDGELYERFFERGVLNDGDTLSYAHGITKSDYRGQIAVGHGGADAGYRTNYMRFPDLDLGVVSFCNFARANPSRYVRQVADIILEDDLDSVPSEVEPPPVDWDRWAETLESLVGFYHHPTQHQPVNVRISRERAVVRGLGQSVLVLIPLGDNQYQLWPQGDTATVAMTNGRPEYLESPTRRYAYVGPRLTQIDGARYAGTYWSEELGTEYQVEADTGHARLIMTHRKRDTIHFLAAFEQAFYAGGDWLRFEVDDAGRAVAFTWSNGRVRKVRFVRRE